MTEPKKIIRMPDLRKSKDDDTQNPRGLLPLTGLIPNMLTILGLCAGLSAIRFAFHQKWEMAVAFIVLAAIIDGMDGRMARLLNATSKFGANLDSLADFLSFGVAPAIIMYLWQIKGIEIRGLGWTLVLLFSACMALRLARFNTALDDEDRPEWKENFFTGVPAPAGAALLMLPMMLTFLARDKVAMIEELPPIPVWALGGYMGVVALLLVSRIPTYSAKKITVSREYVSLVMVVAVLLIALLTLEPWLMLSLFSAIYLCSIPFSIFSFMRMKQSWQAKN